MSHISLLRPDAPGTQPVSATRVSETFWPVFRDLIEVRETFGLSRAVLSTLRALITFMDQSCIVFASNHRICERAEGISQSTFRRHIKALIGAGFARRIDSPNGKRFALRTAGCEDLVFGLDMSPLLAQSARIEAEAKAAKHSAQKIRHLRKALGSLLFHAEAQGIAPEDLSPFRPILRRKQSPEQLTEVIEAVENLLEMHMLRVNPAVSDSQNDCHKDITIKEDRKIQDTPGITSLEDPVQLYKQATAIAPEAVKMLQTSSEGDLTDHLDTLSRWTGVSTLSVQRAVAATGRQMTLLAFLQIIENIGRIKNPPAYFQALTFGNRRMQFAMAMMRNAVVAA